MERPSEHELRQAAELAAISRSAAAFVGGMAALILLAWQFGIDRLEGFVPGFPRMNPLTAVDFIASAAALGLLTPENTSLLRRRSGRAFALFAALTSLLKIVGMVFAWNPGIDEILYRSRVDLVGHSPALMAPGTAVGLLLIAASLFSLDVENRYGSRVGQFIALIAAAMAVIDVAGYADGGQPFLGYRIYHSMSLPTGLSFLALSVGILASRPKTGFIAVCFGKGTGAMVARRLLPLAIITPIVLGWVRVLGERAGWFGNEAGIAFTSAAYIIVLATIVLSTAHALQRIDNQREAMEEGLRKSEERYRLRSAELEVANKELEAFSYSVSHDLRSPLRGIDGFSRILREEYGAQVGEAGSRYIARICEAVERMSVLIDDLLNLSQVSRAEMHRQRIDLSAMAGAIANHLRAGQPERQIEIAIAPGLDAEADSGLMRIVLDNLFGNSWKFTQKREHARIEFGRAEGEGGDCFFVRDNGAGFDQAHAEKLFGAFQRLHQATEFPGTGIGLATVQRIIRRHGGDIWGEGVVGEGATFYFTL